MSKRNRIQRLSYHETWLTEDLKDAQEKKDTVSEGDYMEALNRVQNNIKKLKTECHNDAQGID